MEYISPIVILTEAGIDLKEITAENLVVLQKRLLLEAGLSESGYLSTASFQLSKDDILKLFSNLKQDGILDFHVLIYKNNALFDFLTKGLISEGIKSELNHFSMKEGFTDFISPFLSQRINRLLKNAFVNREFEKSELISSLSMYLNIGYQSAAFDLFAGEFKNFIREITALYLGEIQFVRESYNYLLDISFVRFLNFLPEEFHQRRNHLTSRLNDLGTVLHERDLKFTIRLYEQLQYIRCDQELEGIISNNLNYVKSIQNKNFTYTLISIAGFSLILFFVFKFIDIVYLTSDKEKFNEKQSAYFLGHLYFTEQIRELTASIDLNKVDTTKLSSVPDYPYFVLYSTLIRQRSKEEVKIRFENRSSFDMVIFCLRKQGPFSLSVTSESSKSTYLSINDLFNIYAGNRWLSYSNASYPVDGQPNESLLGLNNGLFVEVNQSTNALFDLYYKIGNNKVHSFTLDQFRNDSLSNSAKLYNSAVIFNASSYLTPSDSVAMDSVLVQIHDAPADRMIQIKPYFHFIR